MISASLVWRKKYQVDRILQEYQSPSVVRDHFPGGWHHSDRGVENCWVDGGGMLGPGVRRITGTEGWRSAGSRGMEEGYWDRGMGVAGREGWGSLGQRGGGSLGERCGESLGQRVGGRSLGQRVGGGLEEGGQGVGRTTVGVLPTVVQRDGENRWDRGVERTSTRAHVERRIELARTVWTEMTANSLEGRWYETGGWYSVTLEEASSLISGVFIPDTTTVVTISM